MLTLSTEAFRGLDTVCKDTCTVILAFKPKNVSDVLQALARGARGGDHSAEGIVIQDGDDPIGGEDEASYITNYMNAYEQKMNELSVRAWLS